MRNMRLPLEACLPFVRDPVFEVDLFERRIGIAVLGAKHSARREGSAKQNKTSMSKNAEASTYDVHRAELVPSPSEMRASGALAQRFGFVVIHFVA